MADTPVMTDLRAQMQELADSTVYDPEKSTLWVASGEPGAYSLNRVQREPDPNAPREKENEDDPRSTAHAMVNTILVVLGIVSFGVLVWSTGIVQLLMH